MKDVDFIKIFAYLLLLDKHQSRISVMSSHRQKLSQSTHHDTMVVPESTTYPGTTEELLLPILGRGSGLKCGVSIRFSPERIDPQSDIKTKNTQRSNWCCARRTEVISDV